MEQKNLSVQLKKAASKAGRWILSASSADRVADTIAPEAYDKAINSLATGDSLITLWQHDHDKPVGRWENLKRVGSQLEADLKLSTTNLGQMIKKLLDDDVPLCASIGFRGVDGEPNELGGFHFTEIELLETSIVSVPCHPNAQRIAKEFGVDLSQADQPTTSQSATKPKTSIPKEGRKMSLAEKIKSVTDELVGMRDNLVQLTNDMDEKTGDELEQTRIAIDELSDNIVSKEADLSRLEKSMDLLKVDAKPVGDGEKGAKARANVPASNSKAQSFPSIAPNLSKFNAHKDDDTPLYVKHATAKFVAHVRNEPFARVLNDLYGDAPNIDAIKAYTGMVGKSTIDIATTSAAGWAQELVRQDVGQFVAAMRDVSVVGGILPYTQNFMFNGANSIVVPVQDPIADPTTLTEPAWVSEGRPIPVTGGAISSATLNRYKLGAITTFSEELAEQSTPQIESIVRELLNAKAASVLDQAFLGDSAAVASVRPAGMGAGVSKITGDGTAGEAAIRKDIVAAVTAMASNRVGSRPVWVLNSVNRLQAMMQTDALGNYPYKDELGQGMLGGIPVIHSMAVPADTAFLIDAALLGTAIDAPMFDVSRVASIIEADANSGTPPSMVTVTSTGAAGANDGQVAPTEGIPISGVNDGAGNAGYQGRSLWQTYSVGVRCIIPATWQRLRGIQGVQIIEALKWNT